MTAKAVSNIREMCAVVGADQRFDQAEDQAVDPERFREAPERGLDRARSVAFVVTGSRTKGSGQGRPHVARVASPMRLGAT